MKPSASKTYHARFQRVLRYIDAHLDEDLSLAVLSGVAAFSKFHFHRQFTALLGIGVHQYVQLVRSKRASYRLAFREDQSILEIALDSGYAGPEAFSRAFKQRVGQSPSEFRKQPDWIPWHAAHQPVGDTRIMPMSANYTDQSVRLVEVEDTRVAVLEHRGDPALIGDSIRRFIAWRKSVGLPPRLSATFNILHDDPAKAAPDEFRLDLCAATERSIMENDAGVVAGTIPGGRCALLRHTGSEAALRAALHYLYADWLPRSGEELRGFPLYVQRVSFFPEVPESEAVTDIFLPLT